MSMVVLYYTPILFFSMQRCETNLEVLRYDGSHTAPFFCQKMAQRDFEVYNTSELYWFKDRQCCYVYLLISCTCSIPLE